MHLMSRREVTDPLAKLEATWRLREREWARKLGRLRLGVEPIDEQLARYRRVTVVLSVVPALIALMVFSLFTAFGRPDIGGIVVVILFVPMIVSSWLGYLKLKQTAVAYAAEQASFTAERQRMLDQSLETTTTP